MLSVEELLSASTQPPMASRHAQAQTTPRVAESLTEHPFLVNAKSWGKLPTSAGECGKDCRGVGQKKNDLRFSQVVPESQFKTQQLIAGAHIIDIVHIIEVRVGRPVEVIATIVR